MNKTVVLTIAGFDPSGGAGLQADLRSFAAHGLHGASVATMLTAQTAEHFEQFAVPASFIAAQANSVFQQFDIAAIKIGMLADLEHVTLMVELLNHHNRAGKIPVVLDPVFRASAGGKVLGKRAIWKMREELLPLVTLVKPNLFEAAALLDKEQARMPDEMREQAAALLRSGCRHVLLSGGHLPGEEAVDVLALRDGFRKFSSPKHPDMEVHGTGCTLTAAIAANLARGEDPAMAVEKAKTWLCRLFNEHCQLDRQGNFRSLDHDLKVATRESANPRS